MKSMQKNHVKKWGKMSLKVIFNLKMELTKHFGRGIRRMPPVGIGNSDGKFEIAEHSMNGINILFL